MVEVFNGCIRLIMLVCLFYLSSFARTEEGSVMQLLQEMKNGITVGFRDQWSLLQKLRYQGIKRHRGLIHIYREIQRLSENVEELKTHQLCSNHSLEEARTENPCKKPAENVEGVCIFIGKKMRSWYEANQLCRSLGGFLFDGRNLTTYNNLRKHLSDVRIKSSSPHEYRYIWVGGHYVNKEWRWTSLIERNGENGAKEGGVPIDPAAWADSQPRSLAKSSLCLALDGNKDFKGVTAFCKHFRKYVCSF